MIIKVKEVAIDCTFGCYHPDQGQDNTCPTHGGDCAACPYCKATVSNPSALLAVQD